MKALVTGGTGCVGSALVERLIEKGYTVRALVRKTSDLSHLRLRVPNLSLVMSRIMKACPPPWMERT